jgi:Na+-translocating ferredoxin:NAD+ oxidoreductase RnfD subunit
MEAVNLGLFKLHGVTYQKTALFVVTVVKTASAAQALLNRKRKPQQTRTSSLSTRLLLLAVSCSPYNSTLTMKAIYPSETSGYFQITLRYKPGIQHCLHFV